MPINNIILLIFIQLHYCLVFKTTVQNNINVKKILKRCTLTQNAQIVKKTNPHRTITTRCSRLVPIGTVFALASLVSALPRLASSRVRACKNRANSWQVKKIVLFYFHGIISLKIIMKKRQPGPVVTTEFECYVD